LTRAVAWPICPGMEWIAVDRGARLRLWRMAGSEVLERHEAPRPETREGLLAAVPDWAGPVAISGGADLWGLWQPMPCAPPSPVTRDRLHILPGLTQERPLSDAVNGAVARIAGLLSAHPDFDGTLVVTGMRTVWASLSAGEVTDVRSTVTGQLFAALDRPGPMDDAAFDAALSATLSRPEALAAHLAAAHLAAPEIARARLSAALIGAELAATKPWWLGRTVLVTGGGALPGLMIRAMAAQGVSARAIPEEDALLAGLRPGAISS